MTPSPSLTAEQMLQQQLLQQHQWVSLYVLYVCTAALKSAQCCILQINHKIFIGFMIADMPS